MAIELDIELLEKLFPFSTDRRRSLFCAPLNKACQEFNIDNPARLAAFCAQIEIESGSLIYVEEIASGKAYEYRADLGNLLPEALAIAHQNHSTTGVWFKGRGLIQITGFYNYRECGNALGVPFTISPKLLCLPEYAAKSAAWFFKTRGCNELADEGRFKRITKIINGGYNHLKERTEAYERNKLILGI
jgi:putative chitinase